jgi:hypothetical protein
MGSLSNLNCTLETGQHRFSETLKNGQKGNSGKKPESMKPDKQEFEILVFGQPGSQNP